MKDWLKQELTSWSDMTDKSCIIVDGDNGAGKTNCVAPMIANILGATIVSVDKYLLENGAPYLDQIKYDDLLASIIGSSPKVVVEGLCMLKVIARIKIVHDYHVFVKRLQNGHWDNSQWLERRA